MSEKLLLLESVLGQGHKTNRDYYQFHCPFCNHHKPKLGVSLGSGKWKCWVCEVSGSKVVILLNKLRASQSTITKAKALFVENFQVKKDANPSLSLPPEYIPLWKPQNNLYWKKALDYALHRGLTPLDIFKNRIGYCDHGKYKDMLIFPFYSEEGHLIYFTGRSYLQNSVFKFSTPTGIDKDLVYDEDIVNWSEPLIIVESKLDAIAVRRNAMPLNGKEIRKALLKKIIDENVKVVYLCLDGDAVKNIMKYSTWFNEHGIDVFKVEFPINDGASKIEGRTVYHDPSSLGHEEVWKYIKNAKKVTYTDSFRYELYRKLQRY